MTRWTLYARRRRRIGRATGAYVRGRSCEEERRIVFGHLVGVCFEVMLVLKLWIEERYVYGHLVKVCAEAMTALRLWIERR